MVWTCTYPFEIWPGCCLFIFAFEAYKRDISHLSVGILSQVNQSVECVRGVERTTLQLVLAIATAYRIKHGRVEVEFISHQDQALLGYGLSSVWIFGHVHH